MNLDVHLPAIMARDTTAFAVWMAAAEGSLRDGLRSFARVVDVEAVLQEALLRVWRAAPRFVPDGEPNGLLRLASRIARNLAISEVRRTKARPALDAEEITDVPDVAAPEPPDPLLRSTLERCYERLPEQPRRAMDARLGGYGDADVVLAEALQMRLNTFLQNVGRARKLLAECLKKGGVNVEGLSS